MADSRLIRECDGESGYQEYKNDLASYAVLADCEYVLKHECPEPIDDLLQAEPRQGELPLRAQAIAASAGQARPAM